MKKLKKIYAIVKEPLETVGYIREIDNTLKAMKEIVGGNIETLTIDEGLVLICNEDGLFLDLPYNCSVMGMDFVGPVMVVGAKGDDFGDVPIGLDQWEDLLNGKEI